MIETATLAGGCFWCLEAVYEQLQGVNAVESGYMGGALARPSYEAVCSGESGHAEVVQLQFDPAQISYREILEVFFVIHDPTTLNRQGNDRGTQYRSAIFYHSPEQAAVARRLIAELTEARAFDRPIVTEVVAAQTFWPAEAYHRQYYRRHPEQGYCRVVIAPKLAKFRASFSGRLKN
ncbi:peptide-methionine (S)-S-oxide reductase [Sulfuritortus calidifontis]|uniref:Peptide methionine sulfoxide reductase MsrA n=1 Tax=Sulfuritortus calidifontis TaxID=1914471 RepID=A0A4R3K0M6_9PROT|nr:peptide-methionine (S)-S-oxide reductase MsrA [Sulfuritortus calidifontis]TCS73789.1 peptide-methionine (S)-S-oxide reductase [Sulfuritortus calidifontis]